MQYIWDGTGGGGGGGGGEGRGEEGGCIIITVLAAVSYNVIRGGGQLVDWTGLTCLV